MNRLFFVPDNGDLGNQDKRIPITEEMFSWNIYDQSGKQISKEMELMHKNVWKTLISLGDFEAVFSIRIDLQRKIFFLADRTWGKIFLNGKVVKDFSHDLSDNAIRSLDQWFVNKSTVEELKVFFINEIEMSTKEACRQTEELAIIAAEKNRKQKEDTSAILLAVSKI